MTENVPGPAVQWVERAAVPQIPRGVHTVEEITAQGLQGVRVWLEDRLYRGTSEAGETVYVYGRGSFPKAGFNGHCIAGRGDIIEWELAVQAGIVPGKPSSRPIPLSELIETRSG